MQSPFLAAINQLCDEKNIPKERVLDSIKAALKAAYKKDYGTREQTVEVELNDTSGLATVYRIQNVVKEIEDEDNDILLKDAKKIKKTVKVGEDLKTDVTPTNYGRIAAQAAKQVIIQKLQEAERDVLYDTFKDRENELINAVIHRVDGRNVFINLDNKTTTVIPYNQQIPGEKYYAGQRLKLYLDKVIKTSRGPQMMISRNHPNLVKKLLELEIPEIKAGVVSIKGIARDAGVRCKIAVTSDDEKIDPIGSCVGQKGVRVQNIMDELNGERMDIIQWSDNMEEYIKASLSPAKTSLIEIDEDAKRAKIYVQSDQRPLAIGKKGQNVRLASSLTGLELDILDMTEKEGGIPVKKIEKSKTLSIADLDLDEKIIESLSAANITLIEQVKGLTAKDFTDIEGIDEGASEAIITALSKV